LKLAVLASGKGTNLNSIINAQKSGIIASKVVLVISNNSHAGALKLARKNRIPAVHLSEKLFPTKEAFDSALLNLLRKYKIDLVILAGYMKLLRSRIVRKYRNRILNIHPALLPMFGGPGMYGIKVHEAVLQAGCKVSGATVHIVDELYDHGAIVIQKPVVVRDFDTPQSLQKRILRTEHKLFPQAIRLFETGKLKIKGRRTYFI